MLLKETEKECIGGAANRQDVIILTKSEMEYWMYSLDTEDFVKDNTFPVGRRSREKGMCREQR